MASYTDAIGTRTLYTWEGGVEKSVTYAAGTAETYTVTYHYDDQRRLIKEDSGVFFEGAMVSTLYAYDSNDNVVTVTEAAGITGQQRITTYVYDEENRLIKETNAELEVTRYFYDMQGNLSLIESADHSFTLYIRDEKGQVEYELAGTHKGTWPADDGTQYARGNWEGYFLDFVRSEHGGVKTVYTYDSRYPSLVATATTQFADGAGDAQTVSYAYDEEGRLATFTDAEGYATTYTYDAFGNIASFVAGAYLPGVGAAGYDATKAAIAAQTQQTTTFVYDTLNRVTREVNGENNEVAYTYDVLGNVERVTTGIDDSGTAQGNAAFQRSTVNEYNADGTVAKMRAFGGGQMVYTYDALGQVTSEKTLQSGDPDNVGIWTEKRFTYDDAGRLTSEYVVGFEDQRIDYSYNAFGDMVTLVRNKALNETLIYDENAVGTARVGSADVTVTVKYQYDDMGRLVESRLLATADEPEDIVTTYTYSNTGNVETVEVLGVADNTTVIKVSKTTNTYDEYGQILATTRQSLRGAADPVAVITYQYDAFGNLLQTEEQALGGSAYANRVTRMAYNANNQVATVTAASGMVTTHSYDSVGQLIKAVESVKNADATLLANTEDAAEADRVTRFEYDRAGRLLVFTAVDGVTETYTYDAAGNKLSETIHNPNALQNSLSASELIDPDRITFYTYDASGRLFTQTTGNNVQTFYYDQAGNVVVKLDANGNETTTQYNLKNRIIATLDAQSNKTSYVYDAFDNLVRITDWRQGNKEVHTEFRYDRNGQIIAQIKPPVETWNLSDQTTPGQFDAAGSNAIGVSRAAEPIVVEMRYDISGNMVSMTDELGFMSARWYDGHNRLVADINGDGTLTQYTYNEFGEIATQTIDQQRHTITAAVPAPQNPPAVVDGVAVTLTWDVMGRLTRTDYPAVDVYKTRLSSTQPAGFELIEKSSDF